MVYAHLEVVCWDLNIVCRLLKMVRGGMKMTHGDQKMVCRVIEGVLLRLEDGLLSRLLKILCRELDILMIVCGVVCRDYAN